MLFILTQFQGLFGEVDRLPFVRGHKASKPLISMEINGGSVWESNHTNMSITYWFNDIFCDRNCLVHGLFTVFENPQCLYNVLLFTNI
jgi:hypothetical protein